MIIKYKRGTLLFFICVIFIWIIFAFSTYNPDYRIYENWYNETARVGFTERFEIIYTRLMMLCSWFGLSYQQFLMVLSAIGYFLIFSTVYKRCQYPTLFAIVYFIYPFFFDIAQIRNFMAMAIVFWGIKFLEKLSLRNCISFGIIVLIAMGFHITAIMYTLFFLALMPNVRKQFKLIGRIFCIEFVCVFLARGLLSRWMVLFGSQEYIDEGSSLIKLIGYIVVALGIFIVTYYYWKIYPERFEKNIYLKIIPTLLLASPLLLFTSQAYRFIRNYSLIIYIAFFNESGSMVKGILKTSRAKNILTIVAIAFALFFAYKQLSGDMFDFLVQPILENNLLLSP